MCTHSVDNNEDDSSTPNFCHRRQLGIVNFEPLRPYFLEAHAGAAASLPLIPGVPPVTAPLDRNWSGDAGATPPTAPALVRR